MSIIAIDCGASFIKTARIALESGQIERIILYHTEECNQTESIDAEDKSLPAQLFRTITAIKKSILELSAPGETIQLGICNEMHGFVLTNASYLPYMDYVSWKKEYILESYTEGITWKEHLANCISEHDVKLTGMPFKAGLPSGNLAYIMKNKEKDGLDEEILFFTLGDYILSWLTKQRIAMHITNAAATGLYDLESSVWNRKLVDALGLEKVSFPEVIDTSIEYEFVWKERRIVVHPAIGDQQAALLGAGLSREGQLSVNMGTGGQVSVISEKLVFSEQYQTRPYWNGKYLLSVPHIPSGRAMNVYFNFIRDVIRRFAPMITDDEVWEWIGNEAKTAKENRLDGINVDLSFFSNAVTNETTGAVTNISEQGFHVGSLFAGIYKKMSENIYACAKRIVTGNINCILFTGGVSRKNHVFRENVMELYGCDVEEIVAKEETFLGLRDYICMKDK